MSFIERALQKARVSTDAAGVQRQQGAALRTPPVRQAPPERGSAPAGAPTPAPPPVRPAVPTGPVLEVSDQFLQQRGLRAPPGLEHQQRAEYRHIKQGLLADVADPEVGRLMLVTSALQGEGKSFSAVHLALSLALEPDYSVLLVDADVIRPNLSRTFGLTDRLGLMDAIADQNTDVQSLIVPTSIERLSLLPAGRPNDNATEYFASARMHETIDQLLAVPNRIVILDTLPLLLTTESRALATLGGQIVMVVRAESTPQSAVSKAVDLLGEEARVKLLLNAVPRTKALDYLGYNYGYGYTYNKEAK